MKKIELFAVAGMLATASIVYATVSSEKKITKKEVKKEVTAKKNSKCNSAKATTHHCIF